MPTCTNQRAIVTSLYSLASVPRKKGWEKSSCATHSGKPVFTLSSSFFVTFVLILWSSLHASEYGLHPLTNETKLWTWRYTKNIKEQYENNHYIYIIILPCKAPLHECASQARITSPTFWDCTGENHGKSTKLRKDNKYQNHPKPKTLGLNRSFTLDMIFTYTDNIHIIIHHIDRFGATLHIYIWYYIA